MTNSFLKAEKRGRAKCCLTLDHICVCEGDVPVDHMFVVCIHEIPHCQLAAVIARRKVLEIQSTLSA